jgi:hypothetical protein
MRALTLWRAFDFCQLNCSSAISKSSNRVPTATDLSQQKVKLMNVHPPACRALSLSLSVASTGLSSSKYMASSQLRPTVKPGHFLFRASLETATQGYVTTKIPCLRRLLSRLAPRIPLYYPGAMITVEKTKTDVRVTIPKGAVPPEQLNAFLDWLRLEEIAQRSRLTETNADQLADEIKGDWWDANKEKFIPASER